VERLSSHLEAQSLSNANVLDDRSIPIHVPGTMQEIDRHVSPLTWRHVKEYLTIKCLWSGHRIEAKGRHACRGTRRAWRNDPLLTLRQVKIDNRWVNEIAAARRIDDSTRSLNLIRCQGSCS